MYTMSTSANETSIADNEEKILNLKIILGNEISRDRLVEILEASNGSLEHAIEIYFHQKLEEPGNVHVDDKVGNSMNEKRSAPIISLEDENEESSSKGISSKQGNYSCKNERKNILCLNDDDKLDNVVNNKRPPENMSSPNHNRKRSVAKQARLDSFFQVNTGKTIASPLHTGVEDRKKDHSTASDYHGGRNDRITNRPAAGKRILHVSRENSPSSKTISTCVAGDKVASDLEKECEGDDSVPSVVSFRRLCETLQEMTDTTKRLVKLKALETLIREIVDSKMDTSNLFSKKKINHVSVRAKTLSSALELVLGGGTSAPLNVSGSAVSKALQTSLGITRNQISKAYRQYGDVGDCAASFFQKKTHFLIASNASRELSILHVTEGLRKITETDGRDAKQHVLHTLLRGCQSKIECRFLVRLLIRNMRIGANTKTVLAALATAMMPTGPDSYTDDESKTSNEVSGSTEEMQAKDAITLVQKTHDICPSLSKIITALLEGGFDQMKRDCSLQVMTPIAPMLAHPVHSLEEIKTKMGDDCEIAIMEWKYDGMRCQAHYDGIDMKLFSRHMLDMTNQFPDVVKFLLDAMRTKTTDGCSSFVIDAEIVGVEGKGSNTHLLPFQDLSTRRKKVDDGNGIRVKVFAFDLMFSNGKSLVNENLFKRKYVLHDLFEETSDFSFVSSQQLLSYDESKIKSYLSEAIEGGAEGLMMKLLGKKSTAVTSVESTTTEKQSKGIASLYEAGTRSHCWLKVKRDYVDGFSDTIDVVPIGAWWGSGRKAQKSFLSPVLLAVYDDEEDVYRSICRCMSFTDAMYESIREFYFNGIEYPACLESGPLENTGENLRNRDCTEDQTIHDNEEGSSEQDGRDHDHKQVLCESEMIGGSEEATPMNRVHCFSDRPSSAFVVTNESPPIWFKPMEVFEVAFADLSLSRQHTAAAGLVDEEGRGVALRFPRFKRRRPDKKPEQATTSIEIAQLFAKQSKIKVRPVSKG